MGASEERAEIREMFRRADRLQDSPGDYFPAQIRAQKALEAWREKYPEAAREERRQRLLADAEDLERKAKGALVYDADGSLSRDDQQRRHDEWMAEAARKREEAEKC